MGGNLDVPTINDILNKIINKEIEFAFLGSICKEKKIRSMKDEFVRLVGASLWEAAQHYCSGYANEGIEKARSSIYNTILRALGRRCVQDV